MSFISSSLKGAAVPGKYCKYLLSVWILLAHCREDHPCGFCIEPDIMYFFCFLRAVVSMNVSANGHGLLRFVPP